LYIETVYTAWYSELHDWAVKGLESPRTVFGRRVIVEFLELPLGQVQLKLI